MFLMLQVIVARLISEGYGVFCSIAFVFGSWGWVSQKISPVEAGD
jgi:hypothetical protein